jgi:hypothetical protein
MKATLLELLDEIRKRIRPVCPNMPEAEFNDLTLRMAEVEYKYDRDPARLSIFPADVSEAAEETPARE